MQRHDRRAFLGGVCQTDTVVVRVRSVNFNWRYETSVVWFALCPVMLVLKDFAAIIDARLEFIPSNGGNKTGAALVLSAM